MNHWFQLIT